MVEGLDRLKRKLTKTIPNAVVDATVKAMETSADEIVGMMKRLVPVDSGNLRDSIAWTWGDAPKGAVVLTKSASRSDGLKITIYAGVRGNNLYDQGWYVRFVEFGTQNMQASPFFFPSWRALRKRSRGRVTRQMRKAVRDGAK